MGVVLRSSSQCHLQLFVNYLKLFRPALWAMLGQELPRNSDILYGSIGKDDWICGWRRLCYRDSSWNFEKYARNDFIELTSVIRLRESAEKCRHQKLSWSPWKEETHLELPFTCTIASRTWLGITYRGISLIGHVITVKLSSHWTVHTSLVWVHHHKWKLGKAQYSMS